MLQIYIAEHSGKKPKNKVAQDDTKQELEVTNKNP